MLISKFCFLFLVVVFFGLERIKGIEECGVGCWEVGKVLVMLGVDEEGVVGGCS